MTTDTSLSPNRRSIRAELDEVQLEQLGRKHKNALQHHQKSAKTVSKSSTYSQFEKQSQQHGDQRFGQEHNEADDGMESDNDNDDDDDDQEYGEFIGYEQEEDFDGGDDDINHDKDEMGNDTDFSDDDLEGLQRMWSKRGSLPQSNFHGVSWDRSAIKWRSRVCFNSATIALGYFTSAAKAAQVWISFDRCGWISRRISLWYFPHFSRGLSFCEEFS